ncbi:signal peptide peptidase SppA [Candidatus Micrarchaeota archaeon]|nr:signal peptide peptidase SppA [Candidatus Micrarchaeota archaeon]
MKFNFKSRKAKLLLVVALLVFAGVVIAGLFVGSFFLVSFLSALFPEPCVGVVSVDGVIATSGDSGLFSGVVADSDDFAELLEEASSRSDVQAIVVEVNSPGGSVVASSEMYSALKNFGKPKVAFFREVAASGGYYLGVGSDYIVSSPDAITGSIGARATFEDYSQLFSKLGMNFTTVKTGELKDIGDPTRPPTEKEVEILQAIVDESFQEFKKAVEEGRKGKPRFTQANLESVSDARILTGRQAFKLGLVDELGDKQAAVSKAAELAGMQGEVKTCVFKTSKGFFEELLQGAASDLRQTFSSSPQKVSLSYS